MKVSKYSTIGLGILAIILGIAFETEHCVHRTCICNCGKRKLPNPFLSMFWGKLTTKGAVYGEHKFKKPNPDNLVVAPSDHVITDEKKFHQAILKGLEFTANHDSLLTIGINPSRPDTGYGYIQFNGDDNTEEFKISKVKTFTEKPNLEMAKFFLKSGEFLWNAGIFLWNAKTILKHLKT